MEAVEAEIEKVQQKQADLNAHQAILTHLKKSAHTVPTTAPLQEMRDAVLTWLTYSPKPNQQKAVWITAVLSLVSVCVFLLLAIMQSPLWMIVALALSAPVLWLGWQRQQQAQQCREAENRLRHLAAAHLALPPAWTFVAVQRYLTELEERDSTATGVFTVP